jgi:hypothetical protein
LDLLFQLLVGLELHLAQGVAALEAPELVGILITSVEPEALGMSVLTTAAAAALLAFLGMVEPADLPVPEAGGTAMLGAEAEPLPGLADSVCSGFHQPFLVHLLILLRLEMVVKPLVRQVAGVVLLEIQEALDQVHPAVGLQAAVLQAATAL